MTRHFGDNILRFPSGGREGWMEGSEPFMCRHCGGHWWNTPVTFNQQMHVDGWALTGATCHQCGEPMSVET